MIEPPGRLLPYDPQEPLALDGDQVRRGPDRETTPDRMWIEVVGSDGRAAGVELRVRLDTVEVTHHGRQRAVFDRDRLRGWWSDPVGELTVDDVTWSVDHAVDVRGRVAVSMPGVRGWPLSPREALEVAHHLGLPLW